MPIRVRTLEQAAAWVEAAGLALLFPSGDYVLPSLWEAVAGHAVVEWAVRDGEGAYVSFTPEMERVWSWKDELPARRLACVGLHLVRTSSLVAPRLVPALYALTGRSGTPDDFRGSVDGVELLAAEALLELGRPATRRELRLLLSADKRTTDRAVNALQRKLVLTNAGLDSSGGGWASTLHDLFARRWRARLRRLPCREDAVVALAAAVVEAAGEVSVADLAAALRLRRREAADALEALVDGGRAQARRDGNVALFSPARATGGAARAPSGRSRAAGSRSSPRRSR